MIRSVLIIFLVLFCEHARSSIIEYDYIRQDRNEKYIVISKHGDKYGVVDLFGNMIIEPKYSFISYSQDSLFWAQTDTTYGIFDLDGESILSVEFDKPISYLKEDYYLLSKNGKNGIFDRKKRSIVIQPKYDRFVTKDLLTGYGMPNSIDKNSRSSVLAYNYTDSITKQSLIDLKTGKEIILEGIFDDIKPSDECGYIVVSSSNQQQVIDYNGNVIMPYQNGSIQLTQFGFIICLGDTCHFVSNATLSKSKNYDEIIPYSNGLAVVLKLNKSGVIDSDGKEIVSPCYDQIFFSTDTLSNYIIAISGDYKDGEEFAQNTFFDSKGNLIAPPFNYRYVEYSDKQNVFVVENFKGKYGLVNTEGKMLMQPKYRRVYVDDNSDVARLEIDDYKMGIADLKGHILAKPQYSDLSTFIRGVAEIGIQDGDNYFHGLIDDKGKEILEPQFTSLFFNLDDEKEYARVYLDNKVGVVSRQGTITVLPQYDDIIYQNRSGDDWANIAITKLNGEYGLINIETGDILKEAINEYIYSIGKGDSILFCVRTDVGNSIIDKQGSDIIPLTKDIIYPFLANQSEFMVCKRESKLGVVDINNHIIIPVEYDRISLLRDNLFEVEKDGETGILNKEGVFIFPLEFDFIEPYIYPTSKLLFAKKGNEYGYIFLDKKEFQPSPIAEEVFKSIFK